MLIILQTFYTVIPALSKFVAADLPINSYFGLTENMQSSSDQATIIVDYVQMKSNDTIKTVKDQLVQIDSNNATGFTRFTLQTTITSVLDTVSVGHVVGWLFYMLKGA